MDLFSSASLAEAATKNLTVRILGGSGGLACPQLLSETVFCNKLGHDGTNFRHTAEASQHLPCEGCRQTRALSELLA